MKTSSITVQMNNMLKMKTMQKKQNTQDKVEGIKEMGLRFISLMCIVPFYCRPYGADKIENFLEVHVFWNGNAVKMGQKKRQI